MSFFDVLKKVFSSTQISDNVPIKTEKSFQVHSEKSGNMYSIDLAKCTCTCPDWREARSNYLIDDPRRICKHLASCYTSMQTEIPASLTSYKEIISSFSEAGRGIPHSLQPKFSGTISGVLVVVACDDELCEWVSIYEGKERYGLNTFEHRWAYGKWPQLWEKIVPLVFEKCNPELFLNIEEFKKNAEGYDTSFDYGRENVISISWENTIFPMIVDAFDGNIPEWIEHEQKKEYFIVYQETSRKWIFRVHYGVTGIKYIEMKNGTEIRVTGDNLIYANSKKKFVKFVTEAYCQK